MLDAPASQALEVPAIPNTLRELIDWDGAGGIVATTNNVWPQVNLGTMRGNTARSGPTGDIWVNSNGWFALLAQHLLPKTTLWLNIARPNSTEMLPAEDYCLAIADSRIYGARWILSLDDKMRAGLLNGDAQAIGAWAGIAQTLAFFESHAGWEAYRPKGVLAVVSDFRNPRTYQGGQMLLYLGSRQIQFVILDRKDAQGAQLAGLKSILWVDKDAPATEQQHSLLDFVQQGGLVIAPSYWGPAGLSSHTADWLLGYDIYNFGKGRIAVAASGSIDPYQLAWCAHVLAGRENDSARIYNAGTTAYYYISTDPESRRDLIQIVNYADRPAEYMALWVDSSVPGARLWSPDAQAPASLAGIAAGGGTSFNLPALSRNCAVEIERSV